ncbi:hypothetical protein Fmac_008340 [Flemingia macrophylla]|uniref:Uncharacterized protein n=1 Tax=Flemingia macrophylla TaxID=520843 RepID=A0ABD1MZI1_9FABA
MAITRWLSIEAFKRNSEAGRATPTSCHANQQLDLYACFACQKETMPPERPCTHGWMPQHVIRPIDYNMDNMSYPSYMADAFG